ncbi:MAG: hypothetical protein HY872_16700 [Chloroflexi bacterium]|nr:hypothetical protein [Chloroflexota bacterium]
MKLLLCIIWLKTKGWLRAETPTARGAVQEKRSGITGGPLLAREIAMHKRAAKKGNQDVTFSINSRAVRRLG